MESDYAEENVSTEQPPTREKARFQGQDGDKERPGRDQAPPGKGPQAPVGLGDPALMPTVAVSPPSEGR